MLSESDWIVFLIPLILLQVILMITALVLIIRQTHFKYFNKIIWIVIVLLLNIVGPVLYFILERR